MKHEYITFWQEKLVDLRRDRAEGLDPDYCCMVRQVLLNILSDIRHDPKFDPSAIGALFY